MIHEKLILFISGIFLVGMAGMAFAEFSYNTDKKPKIEEYGPNGCSKSMEPVNAVLTSGDGHSTHFRIPKAYFSSSDNKGGNTKMLSLSVVLENLSPDCGYGQYPVAKNESTLEYTLDFIITASGANTFNSVLQEVYKNKYTEFVETDSQGFDIYVTKDSLIKDGGGNELLIPKEGYFKKSSFVYCRRPGGSSYKGRRVGCTVYQETRPNLYVQYSFHSKNLENVLEVDRKVEKLLDQWIINESE